MKKRCKILPYLFGLLLAIGLSACSYQTVQPENVPPEQEALEQEELEQENTLLENKDSEKQSSETVGHEADNKEIEQALYSIKKTPKKPSEQGGESSTEQNESESGMAAAESERSFAQKPAQTEPEITEQGKSAHVNEQEKKQEKELKKSQAQQNKQADADAELPDASSSGLHILPEELDDGSDGELANPSSEALISDQEKSGNSNINRKGHDTYLMKEGKPKRFWNLQRQF